jgi:hypothetical protein
MSERYKILDQNNQFFITFATVGWVDVFTRPEYVDIILESIRFCQLGKGLQVYAWCITSKTQAQLNSSLWKGIISI